MPATTTQPDRQRCRHIHADGCRCGSPCLRGEAFCYFHHTSRKPIARTEPRRSRRSAFDLPLPEDRTAIQLSIGEILRRIATNDVDPRRAGLLLYALQIASTNLAQARNQASSAPIESPVEELTVDPALGLLAPPAPFLPAAVSGKPSFFETLIERLNTPPEREPSRDQDHPEASIPDQPQPASPLCVDPLTATPLVYPEVLPILQATAAPSSRPHSPQQQKATSPIHREVARPSIRQILGRSHSASVTTRSAKPARPYTPGSSAATTPSPPRSSASPSKSPAPPAAPRSAAAPPPVP